MSQELSLLTVNTRTVRQQLNMKNEAQTTALLSNQAAYPA